MIDFNKPTPHYLHEKKNIVRLVVFTSVFALVFINLYSPFGLEQVMDARRVEVFVLSSLIILTGVLVVVFSRVILYRLSKKYRISLMNYLLRIAAEIIAMSLFYALFAKYVLKDPRPLFEILKAFAWNTALILLLPYSITWLWFSYIDKKEQLLRISESDSSNGQPGGMITFVDEKGVLRFSVKEENLLFLESSGNYVSICYLNKGKISKYLLRETFKRMEENFTGTSIIRCHRSFMVNFNRVKVIRKDKEGLVLAIDVPQAPDIPVSKTYTENVMKIFSTGI